MNNLFSRMPGLSLAQGLQAGYQAVNAGLQNEDAIRKLSEWDKNAALRDLTRRAAVDQLQTSIPLNAAANKTLLEIQKLRPLLYSRPDGYLQVLNKVSPVGQGMTRRISADGKTIETIDPIGAVVSTTPNFTGKAAENALLNSGGISLIDRAKGLPAQEQADAHNQTQIMIERMKAQAQYDVAELGLRAARAQAAGMAAAGKMPHGIGPDGLPILTPDALKTARNDAVVQTALANGIAVPVKGGELDLSGLTPAQVAVVNQRTYEANNDILAGVSQGIQPGVAGGAHVARYNQRLATEQEMQRKLAADQAGKVQAERGAKLALPTSGGAASGETWYNKNGRELTKDVLGGIASLFDTTKPQDVSQFAPGLGSVQRQAPSPELYRMGVGALNSVLAIDPNMHD